MEKNLCKSKPIDMTTTRMNQSDRFKEAARELGCDETEAAFDEKLKEIAKRKSPQSPEPDDKSGT